jgi:hypothetical protein
VSGEPAHYCSTEGYEKMQKQKEDDKKEVKCILKDAASNIKTYLKDNNVVTDSSYELGKGFRIVRNTCLEIFKDLME